MVCRCGWDCSCTNLFGTRRRRACEACCEDGLPGGAGRSSDMLSRFLARMFDRDRTRKNNRVGDDDLAAFLSDDYRSARLNVVHGSLDAGDADEVADAKRLLKQQKN